MKACKTPVCYVAKNTNLTHCHSPPTQLKLQEKGGTVTRPLQVLHTLQWHRVSPGPIPATPRGCPPRENGAVL